MTGKTHISIGIAIGLTLAYKQPLENQLALVAASSIGALAPDLDHPKGELNQKLLLINNNFFRAVFYSILGGISIYLYSQNKNIALMFLGLFSFALAISNHRSFTHSVLGLIAFTIIVKLISIQYASPYIQDGFIIGYTSHIIADLFTPKGIRLFYPIKKNIAFPISIKNNSFMEKLIFTLFSIYSFALFFINFS